MIKIRYNKVCARCVQSEPLTSGMVGQTIQFDYSADFDGLTVTAVFTNGKKTVDVLNPGAECLIPHEVLEAAGTVVKVGVYAYKGSELVIPTTYAHIGVVLRGADPSGDVEADPTLPIWAQLEAMIGDLADLDTEAKGNLVAAINEAAQTGGGGSGGTANIALRVEGGYIQYTVNSKTWTNLIAVADLKGAKGDKGADGAPGHTPVKGVDYWTAADKAEIVEDTAEAIDLTAYAQTADIPTKTSQLENDSGFLTQSNLQSATDAALAQAKASGEFDGADGHTPEKGVDYWTAADKAEIVSEAAAQAKQAPLIGKTSDLTPMQVYEAVLKGQPVVVQYFSEQYGALKFTSFNIAENFSKIVGSTAVYFNEYTLVELHGDKTTGQWEFASTYLAETSDIPTAISSFTNDSGYLTLATLPKYEGAVE